MPLLKQISNDNSSIPMNFIEQGYIALDSDAKITISSDPSPGNIAASIVAGDFDKYFLFKDNKGFSGQVFVDGVQVFYFTQLSKDARIEIAHEGQRWFIEFKLDANRHKKPQSLYCNYCWQHFKTDEEVIVIDGDEFHLNPCGKIVANSLQHHEVPFQ